MNRAAEQQLGPRPVLPEAWLASPSGTARIVHVERHGQTHELLLSLTRFTLESHPLVLLTLRDIRHVLEQQEIESWKNLTRVLTHEIMNSLTPILSLSKTLISADYTQPSDPEQQQLIGQALQAIHHRSQGLLDFVENYRKLTRLPAPSYSTIPADELFSHLQKLFHDPHVTFDQPYPGFTFPSNNTQVDLKKLVWTPEADDRERIDFIYYHPDPSVVLKDMSIVGPEGDILYGERTGRAEGSQDHFITPVGVWPTDHKALLATFEVK